MILHLVETRNCWLFKSHGEEPVTWYCTHEGGEVLRAAGWRPFEMECVSDFVRSQLLASGDLRILYDIRQPQILELGGVEVEGPMRRDNTHTARKRKHKSRLLLPEPSQCEPDNGVGTLEQHEGGPVTLEEDRQMTTIECPMIDRGPNPGEKSRERC
jgi:hypothetical protein